ncbi:MAG TPA: trimethylamine methyltransferase family protein, partial [Thermoleophilia bacterium]|nr:trimethylamine methyltransferase family protein [Thermoleophilia bacterium]
LCEQLPHLDFVMSMGLPEDAPLAVDDLSAVAAMLAGTRKPLMVATRNGGVVKAVKDMCAAAGAPDSFMIYAMPAPPLMHDRDGLTKLAACAEHEVPIVWAAAPNAGSTGPRSIAGTAVVGNAETLAGLVYHQQIRPGAPFVFGVGVGAMDMRTAVDAYTTPESPLGQAAQEDLCRWYGLPSFNYAAMSDSKTIDEQFALEYGLTAMAGALPRGTLVHDVGYLESGLQSSCESIVFGNAAIGWAKAFMAEVPTDDEALAVGEITEVGPGGNFLARKYTRRHARDFWYDELFDHAVYDRWNAGGRTTMLDRVRARVAELRGARAFTLDPEARARVAAIMAAAGTEREA